MGEVINNLLRFAVVLGHFGLVLGGGWMATAGLATGIYQERLVEIRKIALAKDRKALEKKAKRQWLDVEAHRVRWTWRLATNADEMQTLLGLLFPTLLDAGQIGKGNFIDPDRLQWITPERMAWHAGPWLVVSVVLALILEFLLYPIVRTRVARSLADDSKAVLARAASLPQGDGFVLAHDVRLPRDGGGNPHVLSIAPSGAGKSSSQVLPSLLQLPDDCAAVVTDPKGELLARAAPWLSRQGHKIRVLGPLSGFGYGWDPLRECQTADDARELARQLIEAGDEGASGAGGNWNNMSRTCLSAYLVQAQADGLGLADALQSLYGDEAEGGALTDSAALLDYRQFQTMAGSGNTVGSVLATIQGSTQVWMQDRVVGWMSAKHQMKLSDIRKTKAVVFLVTSASDARASKPIQRVFFARLFDELASSTGTDVRIFLDEFANLGQMQGIDHALNLLRSAGVGIYAFVQNLSQLFHVNGRDAGAVVAESFGTVCVMAGLRNDAQDLAKLLGEREEVRASYSTQDERMRAQFSQNQKQAIDASMLRQIGRDQVLIVCNNLKPSMGRLKPWYRIRKLTKRVLWSSFRADWNKVPEPAKKNFFGKFPQISPVQIVLPKKKKEKSNSERTGMPQESTEKATSKGYTEIEI